MEVRFVSSLTDDDENKVAESLITAVEALLERFSLAYALRIETTGGRVYQATHIAPADHASTTDSGASPRTVIIPDLSSKLATEH
jgi:hypothetical protein